MAVHHEGKTVSPQQLWHQAIEDFNWAWIAVILAWMYLVWMDQFHSMTHSYAAEPMGSMVVPRHSNLSLPSFSQFLFYLFHWQIMLIAMMLPAVLPVVRLLSPLAQSNQEKHRSLIGFLLSYTTIWTVAAIGFYAAQLAAPLVTHFAAWEVPLKGWVVLLAGLFQFTSMKSRCLQGCRSAAMMIAQYYQPGMSGGWRLGWHHGMSCLGCCWMLMGLMAVTGLHSTLMMLVLTGVMTVERFWKHGEKFAIAVGVVFTATGLIQIAVWT
jgi:predicted metal-binding membrane protein